MSRNHNFPQEDNDLSYDSVYYIDPIQGTFEPLSKISSPGIAFNCNLQADKNEDFLTGQWHRRKNKEMKEGKMSLRKRAKMQLEIERRDKKRFLKKVYNGLILGCKKNSCTEEVQEDRDN